MIVYWGGGVHRGLCIRFRCRRWFRQLLKRFVAMLINSLVVEVCCWFDGCWLLQVVAGCCRLVQVGAGWCRLVLNFVFHIESKTKQFQSLDLLLTF